jgi:hypothetical protein
MIVWMYIHDEISCDLSIIWTIKGIDISCSKYFSLPPCFLFFPHMYDTCLITGLTESEQAMLVRHSYEIVTTDRERQGLAVAQVSTETEDSMDHIRAPQESQKGHLAVGQPTVRGEIPNGSSGDIGNNDSGHGLVECSICLIAFEEGSTVITVIPWCHHTFLYLSSFMNKSSYSSKIIHFPYMMYHTSSLLYVSYLNLAVIYSMLPVLNIGSKMPIGKEFFYYLSILRIIFYFFYVANHSTNVP